MVLIANAIMGVGFAAVSAYLHVKKGDGYGWGFAAAVCWLIVVLN